MKLSLLILLFSLAASALALPAITVRGNRLVDSHSGARHLVRGAGYDYAVDDDAEHQWKPALTALLTSLPHLNTIRLYSIDPTRRYDKVMKFFTDHNIYVVIPLTPSKGHCTLNRDGDVELGRSTCYPSCLLTFAQHTINLFSIHSNVLAFTVGNEVLNSEERWKAAPCVKALTRDVKTFMARCSDEEQMRNVPIMYTAADNAISSLTAEANDRLKLDYLTCGRDPAARIDMFGLNLFRWCNDKCTYHSCGSDLVNLAFAGAPIPVIESEFGCADFRNESDPESGVLTNDFREVSAVFGPMSSRFSGAIAYTYGVRGGEEFAFFTGGGRSARSGPGFEKNCGDDGRCRLDEYEKQLTHVVSLNQSSHSDVDDDTQQLTTSSWSIPCPSLFDVDLTIALTRQDADGYETVRCEPGIGAAVSFAGDDEDETPEKPKQSSKSSNKQSNKQSKTKDTQSDKQADSTDDDVPKKQSTKPTKQPTKRFTDDFDDDEPRVKRSDDQPISDEPSNNQPITIVEKHREKKETIDQEKPMTSGKTKKNDAFSLAFSMFSTISLIVVTVTLS